MFTADGEVVQYGRTRGVATRARRSSTSPRCTGGRCARARRSAPTSPSTPRPCCERSGSTPTLDPSPARGRNGCRHGRRDGGTTLPPAVSTVSRPEGERAWVPTQHRPACLRRVGSGDIPTVIGLLADDVTWNVPTALPGGKFAGRDGVGQFFQGIGGWRGRRCSSTWRPSARSATTSSSGSYAGQASSLMELRAATARCTCSRSATARSSRSASTSTLTPRPCDARSRRTG